MVNYHKALFCLKTIFRICYSSFTMPYSIKSMYSLISFIISFVFLKKLSGFRPHF
jgi:hypothetical protein